MRPFSLRTPQPWYASVIKICTFLMILFLQLSANSQESHLSNIISPSPTSYQFARHGNLPISYASGAMSYTLPLYTIKLGQLQMPLSLNYYSNGIKMDDNYNGIGMNWSLQAGGAISRVIRGLPDEQGTFWNREKILGTTGNNINIPYAASPKKYGVDTQKDWFMFNFNGYSGTFYLDENNQPQAVSDSKVHIEVALVNEPPPVLNDPNLQLIDFNNILVFTVTTPDGTRYEFGGQHYAERIFQIGFTVAPVNGISGALQMHHTGSGLQQVFDNTTTFYLKKLVTHSGGEITINYIDNYYKYTSSITQQAEMHNNDYEWENSGITYWRNFARSKTVSNIIVKQPDASEITRVNFTSSQLPSGLYIPFDFQLMFNGVRPDPVTRGIVYDNPYEVSPVFSVMPLSFDKIEVVNSNNSVVQTIEFSHAHVNGRQYLQNVTMKGKGLNGINQPQVYSFEYKNPELLPERLSFAQDYYGYYNGQINNKGLLVNPDNTTGSPEGIPQSLIDFLATREGFFGNRLPVANYVNLGMLTKITYPTKGYTTIHYEPNYGVNKKLYGGARVKYIRDYDGHKLARSREIYYNAAAKFPSANSSIVETTEPRFFDKGLGVKTYTLSSASINTIYSNRKSNHLYNYVTELEKDANGEITGATERAFATDADPIPFTIQGTVLFTTPSSNTNGWRSGLLIGEKKFIFENNEFQLKEETSSLYQKFNEKTFNNYVVALTDLDRPDLKASYTVNLYQDISCDFRKTEQTTTILSSSGALTKVEKYHYTEDSYVQLRKTEAINSKNEVITTEYQYAQDISSPTVAQQKLIDQHRISQPLITKTYNNQALLATNVTTYKDWGNNRVLPEWIEGSTLNNPLEPIQHVLAYDPNSNLLEIDSRNGLKETYLWGYQGQYPVARITGTSYTTATGIVNTAVLNNAAGAYSDQQMQDELNKLYTHLGDKIINTYKYMPLIGMTSETDTRGKAIYYEYDSENRLFHVKDNDQYIIKKMEYEVGVSLTNGPTSSIYYNTAKTSIFYKDNCPAGQNGTAVPYTVAANTFSSTFSQAAADEMTQNDIDNQGQAYANQHGVCLQASWPTFYNLEKHDFFTSVNCSPGKTIPIKYSVPAGTYTSDISQQDADRKASNSISLHAQKYANDNGVCYSSLMPPWIESIYNPLDGSSYSYSLYYYCTSLSEMCEKLATPSSFGSAPLGPFQLGYSNPYFKYISVHFYPDNIHHRMYESLTGFDSAPDGYYVNVATVSGSNPNVASIIIFRLKDGLLHEVKTCSSE
ncbi:hypothetical protein HNQ91_002004 [Filimonas zeae]|nr:DUF5977 domain-containing protein [Filimonas zeae]MDR6338953.1 hypothetical protein [Filimonas zeae]